MFPRPHPPGFAAPGYALPERKPLVFLNSNIRSVKKSPVTIQIVGLILSASYQRCKLFAQKLRKHHARSFLEPRTRGYLEMDWAEYLAKLQREVGGQTWAVRTGVAVFVDGNFIGSEKELFARFNLYAFKSPPSEAINNLAKREYLKYLNSHSLLYTFFELSVDGEYMGSLLFELQHQLLPKSSARFALLNDPNNHTGKSYKGTRIHRVCRSGWFQGGDVKAGVSLRNESDESLCYKHDRRGVLSFANCGKGTNKCQFFVTFKPSRWMDEYYVAFGRVVEGSEVLRRLESVECSYEDPHREIVVSNCGVVEVGLGKSLVTRKMRALTIGDVHIDPKWIMDLVLDRFCEVLMARLAPAVKTRLQKEWTAATVWERILPQLMFREPVDDYPDSRDRSSEHFLAAAYLQGLYDLKEIPDHFIMDLLDHIVDEAVEKSDVVRMARSIVDLIVNSLDLEHRKPGEVAAESFIKRLSRNVERIIFGSQDSQEGSTLETVRKSISSREFFLKLVYKDSALSGGSRNLFKSKGSSITLSKTSSDEGKPRSVSYFAKNSELLGEFLSDLTSTDDAESVRDNSSQKPLTARESLLEFIREMLVESLTK